MQAHDGDAPRSAPRRRRLLSVVLGLLAVVAAAAAAVTLLGGSSDDSPGAFYEQPDPLPAGGPGTLLRSEAIAGPPAGTRAYRILYRSRGHTGTARALSALLFVPLRPAPIDGRNVVAFIHGTVGVAPSCAISRGRSYFAHVAGLARFIRAGYAVVVPDLEGLGTDGPHPYLVGEAAARATLDGVRATRRFDAAGASARFVAWGVGQGGHAAIFTGQEARTYAPELELAGVAAGAPAANLGRLLTVNMDTTFGRVLAAYTLATWSRVYPQQVRLQQIVDAPSRTTIEQVAERCLPLDHGPLRPALRDLDVTLTYRAKKPWEAAPLKALLARNAPGAKAIAVPVIITQGANDTAVRPSLTARFVRYLCSQGATVQYRPSRAVAHADLGEKTAPYVSKWIASRFAGDRARSTC